MCDTIKLLFTFLYVMYDVSLNVYTYIIFYFLKLCVIYHVNLYVFLSISLVFGFYRKTEVKNRNQTSRFFIFYRTDRFLMSEKLKNRTEV
jgi:hypothetical protein